MPQDYPDFTFTTHVRTLAADNIIIDKLTDGACMARVFTLQNHGDTAKWYAPTGNDRRGKLFPRGARGFIVDIDVYCRDKGTAGGKVYVELWVTPYTGPVYTGEITVPAGGDPAWRTWSPQKFWNYDSLLIVCYTSSVDIELGYDDGGPDAFHSADAGMTWTGHPTDRFWFRADLQGMTVGDVPVSGTVNTIEIPMASSEQAPVAVTVTDTEKTVFTIEGAGVMDYLEVVISLATANSHRVLWRVICDGVQAWARSFRLLNAYGYTTTTPGVTLMRYAVDGICSALMTTPFRFKRKLEVRTVLEVSGSVSTTFYAKVHKQN